MSPIAVYPAGGEDGANSPDSDLSSSTHAEVSSFSVHLQAPDALNHQKSIERNQKILPEAHIYRPNEPPFEAFYQELDSSGYSWIRNSLAEWLKIRPEPLDHVIRLKVGNLRLESIGTVHLQIRPEGFPIILPERLFHVTKNPDIPDMILGREILGQVKAYRARDRDLRPRWGASPSLGGRPPERPSVAQYASGSDLGPMSMSMSTPMNRGSSSNAIFFSARQHPGVSSSSQGVEAITQNIGTPKRVPSWMAQDSWLRAHPNVCRTVTIIWRSLLCVIAFSFFYDMFLAHELPHGNTLAFIFRFGDMAWTKSCNDWIIKPLQIGVILLGIGPMWGWVVWI